MDTLAPGTGIGTAVLNLTTLARQKGGSLQDAWLGNWKPALQTDQLIMRWLRWLLLDDETITLAVDEITEFYSLTRPTRSGFVGASRARDAWWQVDVMLLLAGCPQPTSELRPLGIDRALRLATLCVEGWEYTVALNRSIRPTA